MATATHAEQMVTKLEEVLLDTAGLNQVTVDGQTMNVAGAEKKLAHYKRIVAREKGTRPIAAGIKLGGF